MLVPGGMFSEAVFFHEPSRTLILTDLIENFELDRISEFSLLWIGLAQLSVTAFEIQGD
ncbi:MAG: DUF4336 domain-containing protein [Pseudomonadota bacterium]|nr:DUF4336 domain-containing protein [Pseudomonadota bacterium]